MFATWGPREWDVHEAGKQLLVAVNGLAVAEAMALGRKPVSTPSNPGDDPKSAGDSWMFRNRAPQMVSRDFTCGGA